MVNGNVKRSSLKREYENHTNVCACMFLCARIRNPTSGNEEPTLGVRINNMDTYRNIYLVYFCFISLIVLFICWFPDKFTCIGHVCCVYIHICRRVRIHMHHRICGIDLSISFYIYLSVCLSIYLSIFLSICVRYINS